MALNDYLIITLVVDLFLTSLGIITICKKAFVFTVFRLAPSLHILLCAKKPVVLSSVYFCQSIWKIALTLVFFELNSVHDATAVFHLSVVFIFVFHHQRASRPIREASTGASR